MGWRKRARKIFKKAKSLALLDPGTKMVKGLVDSRKADSGSSGGDEGLRSAAAKRLVNRNQQAGSGAINFNTEEYS